MGAYPNKPKFYSQLFAELCHREVPKELRCPHDLLTPDVNVQEQASRSLLRCLHGLQPTFSTSQCNLTMHRAFIYSTLMSLEPGNSISTILGCIRACVPCHHGAPGSSTSPTDTASLQAVPIWKAFPQIWRLFKGSLFCRVGKADTSSAPLP